MKERFKSDPSVSNETYAGTYKRYPSFKIGIAGIVVCAGGILYDLYNLYLWIAYGCGIINIAIHILILLLLACGIYLSMTYMKSGGKGCLIDRQDMILDVYADHMTVRYSLTKSEKKKYRAIRMHIYYCDIDSMIFDQKMNCLKITGDYAIERVPIDGKSFDDAIVEDVANKSMMIYNRFDNFKEIMKLIEQQSFKKISYETATKNK